MIHIDTDTFRPFAAFPQCAAQSSPDPSVERRKHPPVCVHSTSPRYPVLRSVSPSPATPGQQVTVIGSNLRQGEEPYTAYFISSSGKRVSASLIWLNITTFRVVVPDMEKSYGAQDSAQYPDTFHVTRGSTPSNRLLKVLPAPRCVLTSVTPTVQDAKGYVTMNGNYLTADCDITFYTPTGQAFPATKKNMIYSGLNVQVPDMPGSKGSVSARPAGAAQSGAMIPFEVRGLTPLLATRADMSAIGGFGQKIMGIEWKTYKAYASPVTPDQPFKCDAKCEVYQNGNVYTYVYMFTMNEFVVTTRTLNYMTLVWPDLNDSSLKYGVGLEKTKMTATDAQYWIKGETRHNLEMGFFSQRGKDLCVYIQSKRPPKQGNVQIADEFGQLCFINDFMIPTP